MTEDWPEGHQNLPDFDKQARLYEALVRAQGGFPKIPRDKTVTVNTKGGQGYKFSYAPFESILRSIMPVLKQNGLSISQGETPDGFMQTTLMHVCGGTISSLVKIPEHQPGMQAHGSALTYSKRYGFSSLLCICPDDDDDANQADGNSVEDVSDKEHMAAAQRFRDALDEESDPNIYAVHLDLNAAKPLYNAAWKLLDSKERSAIKSAIARMKTGGPAMAPNGRATA